MVQTPQELKRIYSRNYGETIDADLTVAAHARLGQGSSALQDETNVQQRKVSDRLFLQSLSTSQSLTNSRLKELGKFSSLRTINDRFVRSVVAISFPRSRMKMRQIGFWWKDRERAIVEQDYVGARTGRRVAR